MTTRTEKPLDYSGQVWRGIDDKFPKKIHNATSTSDGLMSAEDKAKLDSIDATLDDRVYDVASKDNDGLMSAEDKAKLDGIEDNANNYIHPDDENTRHVTDEQISAWDAKAETTVVDNNNNGLMSAEDKKILDFLNNYYHWIEDTEQRYVSDEQIAYWNNKVNPTDLATSLKNGLMIAADKAKLNGIEEGANKYIHPNNEGIRHVSDAQIAYWNSKADKSIVTNSEDGLMAFIDKIKLDGIEENANNYIHPDDENTRHVTDEQIAHWDAKGVNEPVTYTKNGLMTFNDKIILDKLALIDPEIEDKHFVTTEEKEKWNNNTLDIKLDLATKTENGLMSAEDKTKLDNLTNYTHPDTHLATMIVEDDMHRFVTDEQIAKLDQIVNPETQELELVHSNWSNEKPFTQILNVPGINPTLNVYIGINPSATIEEMTVAANAKIQVGNVEQDKITIIANGEKPDRNLPIIVMIGSTIVIIESKQNNNQEYAYEIPLDGNHYQNEIVYSYQPVQTKCIGWVCTETGNPGKWVPFGTIEISE